MEIRHNSVALKYEDNDDDQQVRKIVAVKRLDGDNNDGFVSQDQILGEINTAPQPNRIDMFPSYSNVEEKGSHDPVAPSFASIYSKNKSLSLLSSSIQLNTPKSTLSVLAKKPTTDDSSQLGKFCVTIQNFEQSSKSNETKLQAKRFFDEAKMSLEKDHILEVQRLVVTMKSHGDSKNSAKYIETTKELIKVLVNSANKVGDGKCIRLIRLLFPLLPAKFRYKSEKMAARLCFEKSVLRKVCKEVLSEQEFSLVNKIVLTMIFDQEASYNSMIDASNERTILEEAQKVLTVLTQHDMNLQSFFDLLPDRHLRKVKSLAMEIKKSRDIVDAKIRSSNYKGEDCVNTALFLRNTEATSVRLPKQLEALQDPDAEKNLTDALKKGASFNREKLERFQREETSFLKKQPDTKSYPIINPYIVKSANPSKESAKRNLPLSSSVGAVRKRPFHGTDSSSSATSDVIRALDKVKANGFVQGKTKADRINGKINANVPKGFSCMICYNVPEEVRVNFYC